MFSTVDADLCQRKFYDFSFNGKPVYFAFQLFRKNSIGPY